MARAPMSIQAGITNTDMLSRIRLCPASPPNSCALTSICLDASAASPHIAKKDRNRGTRKSANSGTRITDRAQTASTVEYEECRTLQAAKTAKL